MYFNLDFDFPQEKNTVMHILRLVVVFVARSVEKFYYRVVSHFHEKFDSTVLLKRETHDACDGGGSLQRHHFNAFLHSSTAFAGHSSAQIILKIVCRLNGQ